MRKGHGKGKKSPTTRFKPRGEPQKASQSEASDKSCYQCGYKHYKGQSCPAKGKTCKKCNKMNHFATVCRSKKQVDMVEMDDQSDDSDAYCYSPIIDAVTQEEPHGETDQLFVKAQIGKMHKHMKLKVDTGAQVNVMPLAHFQKVAPKVDIGGAAPKKLYTYGNKSKSSITVLGKSTLECVYKGSTYEFLI